MNKTIDFSNFANKLFEKIDISPTQYDTAVDHYEAVAKCLVGGSVGDDIYPQGSFALGTVVRPFRGGKDADFDLDLVSQLNTDKNVISSYSLKSNVKECLINNSIYKKLLDPDEGRRCWRLNYAEKDGIGFHMDILPCTTPLTQNHRIQF